MSEDDAFWDIQLNTHECNVENGKTWLAPPERNADEGLNLPKEKREELYTWETFTVPNNTDDNTDDNADTNEIIISTRCLPADAACSYMSNVGEELWDASKLFACWLLQEEGRQVNGKRVLELGSGCGFLGMITHALGATQVVCTDYLPDVLDNLAYNIQNYRSNQKNTTTTTTTTNNNNNDNDSNITTAYLDWESMALPDLFDTDWLRTDSNTTHTNDQSIEGKDDSSWAKTTTISKQIIYPNNISVFKPHIIIGAALIYSPQGISCADTIHYYMTNCGTTDAFILQMLDRPGFDRFLLRIQQLGHSIHLHPISDILINYDNCIAFFGQIGSPKENFNLLHIKAL